MTEFHVPETHKIILSVNDKHTMEQPMYQWFFEHGVALIRARSTAKAMELLGRAKYDAVITNLRRDENGRKNDNAGIDLVQQIRRGDQHVPIFIYTMNIDQATRQSALNSGATHIISSPADLQSLLKKHIF